MAGVLRRQTRRAALSLPRGNGKSWICGFLASEALRPGGRLWTPGAENVLLSGSFDQARYVYRFAKDILGEDGYAYQDNKQQMGIRHKASGTRLLVKSSRARGAFGIVGARIAIADEPGAWDTVGGEMMADALDTAIGKPGTDLTVVYVGTLAPSSSGWWHDLIADGSQGSTFVQSLTGKPDRWDQWSEIRRCNPLTAVSAEFRRTLLEERDKARRDTRLKARFLSYRLNLPTADESAVLLTVEDWQRVCAREAGDAAGRPIVGVDLGGGRAWSAAVAIWPSGRIEAVAVAPGLPSIAEQETRDRVPRGTYQRLVDAGVLTTDGQRRVPRVEVLAAAALRWRPLAITCDRFRLPELQDATGGRVRLVPRVTRWSESSADIRELRRMAKDGPLSCAPSSRPLLEASLSVAQVQNDSDGNVRLVKRGSQNEARDDVAAALKLAAGAHARRPAAAPRRLRLVAV